MSTPDRAKFLVTAVLSVLITVAACGADAGSGAPTDASPSSALTATSTVSYASTIEPAEFAPGLHSDAAAEPLPEGSVTVAGVELGEGRRLGAVGWVSVDRVDDAGEVWTTLANAFPSTGLWPILVPLFIGPEMPIREAELRPVSPAAVDAVAAEEALGRLWAESINIRGTVEFPGLAEATSVLSPDIRSVAGGPYYLALIPVERPADVPAVLGWTPYMDPADISAVLRSWEDRFGWYLSSLGLNVLEVSTGPLVLTDADAGRLAAEIVAMCPEFLIDVSIEELGVELAEDWETAGTLFLSW